MAIQTGDRTLQCDDYDDYDDNDGHDDDDEDADAEYGAGAYKTINT